MKAIILCTVLSAVLALGCGEAKKEETKKEGVKKEAPKEEDNAAKEGKKDDKLTVRVKAGPMVGDEAEGINKGEIEGILRGKTVDIQRCYYEWVKENEGKEGSLLLGIAIDTDGAAEVEVIENGFDDDVVGTCAAEVVKGISFPIPSKKATLKVPFKFRSL